MHSAPYKLDQLPVEILRHIASLGNCETVLALSEVNNTLRAACHDGSVYKALIDNRNGYRTLEWPHHLPLTMQSPVSSWARYALADSRAVHDNASNLKITSILSWAPQLLAYHHPMLNLCGNLMLAHAMNDIQRRTVDATHALAFCLALLLMSTSTAEVLKWPRPIQGWTDLTYCLSEPLQSPSEAIDTFTACDPAMLMQKRVRALTAVGVFSVVLRGAIERGRIISSGHVLHQSAASSIPRSINIPFHSMLDVPLPFASNASEEILSCHLAKMTTVDFLEDGEWTGFYSMSSPTRFHGELVRFDPPMRGIRFVATAPGGDSKFLSLRGTGEDAIDAFDLEGQLAPQTGNINLRKTYSGGSPAWDWVCIMTPVGIVGSWGPGEYGGWIWLWKTGWTASQHL